MADEADQACAIIVAVVLEEHQTRAQVLAPVALGVGVGVGVGVSALGMKW